MTSNPFAAPTAVPDERGVVFAGARIVRSRFLYRVFDTAADNRVVYDAWWFRQRISIDGHVAWSRISWLTIEKKATFRVPAAVDPSEPEAAIEIEFTRGLMIRRFRFWIGGQIVYDEIN